MAGDLVAGSADHQGGGLLVHRDGTHLGEDEFDRVAEPVTTLWRARQAAGALSQLNPVEVRVDKFAWDKPNQVALVPAQSGSVIIFDETVFRPESFFMAATDANRSKLLRTKASIESNRRDFEELNKQGK